jgi:hypothetical protein
MRAARARPAGASRAASTPRTVVDRGEDATIKLKTLRERVLVIVGYRPFARAPCVYHRGGRPAGGRTRS